MRDFNFLRSKSFTLDLGNNNTLVSDEQSIIFDQPSFIVFDGDTRSVKAVGDDAYNMFEKSHHELRPVKPLRGGVIADYESASLMLSEMIKRTRMKRSFFERFNHIISGVPYTTTPVERNALSEALGQFNARKTYLVFEPLAAALGMGLDIQEPDGKMIVDIGGGITEIVVISLSGIACFESLKIAGDTMDSDIKDHFRRHYNMSIGLKTAEHIKIHSGSVIEDITEVPEPLTVKGKDLITGVPIARTVGHQEVCSILQRSINAIEHAIIQTLQKCPPELASDIYENGIQVTGGNAMLRGLKERLQRSIGVKVFVDETALHSVSKGTAIMLRNTSKYQHILLS
jgi:rod shape-determining protein MreB